jgi:hypothetical protein
MKPTNRWLASLGLAGACLLWFPGPPSATASGPGVSGSPPRPANAPPIGGSSPPAVSGAAGASGAAAPPATISPPAVSGAAGASGAAVPPATIAPPAGGAAALQGAAPATITPPANLTPPPIAPNNTPPPAFPGADPAPPGGGGGGGGKALAGNGSFKSPSGAVTAFLAALKARDLDALTEATALHAQTEAKPGNQKLFTAILDGSLAKDELDELAKKLDGYKIIDQNDPKSSGRQGIILSKPEKNGAQMIRTITTRHEKKGWKVVDISGAGKLEKAMMPIRGMTRGGVRRR